MSPPEERTAAPPRVEEAAATKGKHHQPTDSDAAAALQRQQDIHRLLVTLGGQVQFVSIVPRGNGEGPMRVATFTALDLPAAVAWVARNDAEGRASYFSLSIVREGLNKKATKADIVAARGLFVDIDPPKDGQPFDRNWALEKLHSMELPPSLIINSGNGLQPIMAVRPAGGSS